jgi:RNA polymerase sigma-70 factor (ECF subfamily)
VDNDDDLTRRQRFETLASDVIEPVRRFLARRTDPATADDVLSETLIVLWRRFEDVPDAQVAWAIGIARLQLANAARAQRRQERLARRIAETPAPTPQDTDTAEAVRRAILRLRPGDAEVVRLWAWEGLEPAQLAVVLGISANAAAVRLHRARRRFAEQFGKENAAVGHEGGKERIRP